MNYENFDFRERYNEVMYDERDVIRKFLEDHYDIRYGRQRGTWHFEPAIELIATNGSLVQVHDIKLDKGRFVVFNVEAFCEKNVEWECFDFAYSELSKVINALPDTEDIKYKNAVFDLCCDNKKFGLNVLLKVAPFVYNNHGVPLRFVELDGNIDSVAERLAEYYGKGFVIALRNHVHIEHLRRTEQYKKVVELLNKRPDKKIAFDNFGELMFPIKYTDLTFDVSRVGFSSEGFLVIEGGDVDDPLYKGITLDEKDIDVSYLEPIIAYLTKSNGIIDEYNGHNPELVCKINAAWRSDKYHDRFGDILYALACRDMTEWEEKYNDIIHDSEDATNHAHEIMEGVCDDVDLECILKFIRYE